MQFFYKDKFIFNYIICVVSEVNSVFYSKAVSIFFKEKIFVNILKINQNTCSLHSSTVHAIT